MNYVSILNAVLSFTTMVLIFINLKQMGDLYRRVRQLEDLQDERRNR